MPIIDKLALNDEMKNAIEAKDHEGFVAAIGHTVDAKAEEVLAKQLEAMNISLDKRILNDRGVKTLTSSEYKYFDSLIHALRSPNYQDALRQLDVVYPKTLIDEIFNDLTQNHQLLSHVDLQHVNMTIKLVYAVSDNVKASWTALDAKIDTEVAGEFKEMDAFILKLTAHMPIPNSMLDLGPAYLERFIRILLTEAIANGLEDGIINGFKETGPLGMQVDLDNASKVNGVITYTKKTPIAITEWTPEGIASVLGKLVKTRNGNYRPLNDLILIVNPEDYYTKFRPAISYMTPSGDWIEKHPVPLTVVQSAYMEKGKAIIGIGNRYAVGVGTAGGLAGTIEYSDEFDFLNDRRTYKIKLYANGWPKDNTSFEVLDISGLKKTILEVKTVTDAVTEG